MDTLTALTPDQVFFMHEDLFGTVKMRTTVADSGIRYYIARLSIDTRMMNYPDSTFSSGGSLVSGMGESEEEALADLLESLTMPGGFFFVTRQIGKDLQVTDEKNIAWNGRRFYELGDIAEVSDVFELVKSNRVFA
jgi:hypothetical protein